MILVLKLMRELWVWGLVLLLCRVRHYFGDFAYQLIMHYCVKIQSSLKGRWSMDKIKSSVDCISNNVSLGYLNRNDASVFVIGR